MKKKQAVTRRQFIKNSAIAAAGGAFLRAGAKEYPGAFDADSGNSQSRVVLIRDSRALNENEQGAPRPDVIQEMLDEAVLRLVGEKDIAACWRQLVNPEDTVGIKTNVWRYLPTTTEVEQAIKARVLQAGVPENRIGIRDRGVLKDPVFKQATALINARPMRSHHWSGVGSLIKNYIMFVPRPYEYHGDSCADLATIWKLPVVKDKTRLNVLVMLTPQFHGVGPHAFNPKYVWRYNGLLVGYDPVALDATGVRIIEARRRAFFGEDRPLNPPAKHIALADTRHHLGNADPGKIKLIFLGDQQDRLI